MSAQTQWLMLFLVTFGRFLTPKGKGKEFIKALLEENFGKNILTVL